MQGWRALLGVWCRAGGHSWGCGAGLEGTPGGVVQAGGHSWGCGAGWRALLGMLEGTPGDRIVPSMFQALQAMHEPPCVQVHT